MADANSCNSIYVDEDEMSSHLSSLKMSASKSKGNEENFGYDGYNTATVKRNTPQDELSS
jgi:hypothetical protein